MALARRVLFRNPMMTFSQLELMARANRWLKSDAHELDPAKIVTLRQIAAGTSTESPRFAEKLGVKPGEAAEYARYLLLFAFADSIAASEKAAAEFASYLPQNGVAAKADHAGTVNPQLTLYRAQAHAPRSNRASGRVQLQEVEAGVFPLRSMDLLMGAFRLHRASLEATPVARRQASEVPQSERVAERMDGRDGIRPQLALKDPSGRLLLFEIREQPEGVVVSLGMRADFVEGTPVARSLYDVSGAFAAELLPWLVRAVQRSPHQPPDAARVIAALEKAVSHQPGPLFSVRNASAVDTEKFERLMTDLKPRHANSVELRSAFTAAWNIRPIGVCLESQSPETWKTLGLEGTSLRQFEELRWATWELELKFSRDPTNQQLAAELSGMQVRQAFELWMASRENHQDVSSDARAELLAAFSGGSHAAGEYASA